MSEQLDAMKSSLISIAQSRMGDLEHTDAKELGEVIDMIKDLEEAKYYCSITQAMTDSSTDKETQSKIDMALMNERLQNQTSQNYYGGPYMRYPDKMYYDGRDERRGGSTTERSYTTPTSIMRDYREGKSSLSRKGYVESKDMHLDTQYKMDRLSTYLKELGEDVTEMINGASPEEKKMLKDKLTSIAQTLG